MELLNILGNIALLLSLGANPTTVPEPVTTSTLAVTATSQATQPAATASDAIQSAMDAAFNLPHITKYKESN